MHILVSFVFFLSFFYYYYYFSHIFLELSGKPKRIKPLGKRFYQSPLQIQNFINHCFRIVKDGRHNPPKRSLYVNFCGLCQTLTPVVQHVFNNIYAPTHPKITSFTCTKDEMGNSTALEHWDHNLSCLYVQGCLLLNFI